MLFSGSTAGVGSIASNPVSPGVIRVEIEPASASVPVGGTLKVKVFAVSRHADHVHGGRTGKGAQGIFGSGRSGEKGGDGVGVNGQNGTNGHRSSHGVGANGQNGTNGQGSGHGVGANGQNGTNGQSHGYGDGTRASHERTGPDASRAALMDRLGAAAIRTTTDPSGRGNEKREITCEVLWSSENHNTASVDGTGTVRGLRPGRTTIHAVYGHMSASMKLMVEPWDVVTR
jgi:hypothetical protein